ncbi:FliO/MopB family protein [Actinoplanes sp. CA-030573]|uniref:FliO/MopB family protein n=1 Tax=Actinoplanes sp. CA-030573 TaxID=3239898 RepID=UPI003D8D68B6
MFELVLRIGFSLFVVLGLMWALARVVRRPLGARRPHGELAVLNRQQLTRNAEVIVVKVADRAMILGVTEAQVNSLGEANLADFEHPHEHRDHLENVELPGAHPASPAPGRLDKSLLSPKTWTSTIDFLRDRTSRH